MTQHVQLTLADAYEDDEITWDEWVRSLPLDPPGGRPRPEAARNPDPAPVRKYPRSGSGVTEPLITAREAAVLLGVATGTVLDWWEAGRLPGFRLGGSKGAPVRFRPSELEAWLEGCRRGPAPSQQRAKVL